MVQLTTKQEKHLLRKALRYWGVQPDYTDSSGKSVSPSANTLLQLLQAVSGVEIKSVQDLEDLVRLARDRKVQRILEPVVVFHDKRAQTLNIYLPIFARDKKWTWQIHLESGEYIREDLILSPTSSAKSKFEIKTKLPLGYHTLELQADGDKVAQSFILCAPELKVKAEVKKKSWGAFAPLYGLRRQGNWGIGDLTDLAELQSAIHEHGASFFGTLPILASIIDGPGADPSPYSPVSRLFWNEIFLDVDVLAKDNPAAQALIAQESFQQEQERLRKLPMVDYIGVAKLKRLILNLLAQEFFVSGKNKIPAYQDFLKHNSFVEDYAKFRAQGDERELEYHLYVQFQMDEGLKNLGDQAKAGKTAGLYLDFPVGVSRTGFDALKFASSFVNNLSSGAPPDMVFAGGQNWGFAPLHPHNLREEGYRYFIECMRQHMRHAQVLRLDHVMAFTRIYSIPAGVDPKSGGYIRYRAEEFFAVLAIEAFRADVTIVGEDLGTVPSSMRKALNENNCLGMWVLPFESGESPTRAALKARTKSLACLNTHDMVPWAGFCVGKDAEIFHKLGVFNGKLADDATVGRKHTLSVWRKDVHVDDNSGLFIKLTELMAQGPCELFLLTMEDLWGEVEPQNVPGTWREHPNWRHKLKLPTHEWRKNPQITSVMDQITKWRQHE